MSGFPPVTRMEKEMRISIASLLVALAVTALPAGAAAAVPPGNSGADEYAESFPGAGGNQPSANPERDSQPTTPSRALGEENAERLEAAGPDGRAAAQLAASTAPGRAGDSPRAGRGDGKPLRESLRDSNGDGVLGVATKALGGSGSGGMGILLPAILFATLALATGAAIARRQRHRELSR